jgi:hypothetical protein
MEQMNFHKQKLYALISAAVALVGLLLPWLSFFMGSVNGMRGWGVLSLLGVIAIVLLTIMGNKPEDYTAEFKKYVMISFGAIALGALLFLLRKSSFSGGMYGSDFIKTGIGLWITLLAGLAGFALIYGLINIQGKPGTKTGV